MKCIKCDTDNKLKDRTDGVCQKCRHPIVFDPKRTFGDFFNDKLFQKTVALISVSNTLKFTPRQYYYFINNMKAVNPQYSIAPLGCFFLFAALVSFFIGLSKHDFVPLFVVPSVLLLISLFTMPSVLAMFGIKPRRSIRVTYGTAVAAFDRWAAVNEPIDLLLPNPLKSIPSGKVAAELLDYSFDRLIVTETDEIAQFLIANNFHFENNCAVLSINKYPIKIFDTIMMMLKNNPELKVFVLHNASWRGISILDQVRNEWFKDQPTVQIIDLGLLPRQFEKKAMFVETDFEGVKEAKVSAGVRESLTQKERKWLSEGNAVKAESIAPQNLLRMIATGFAMSKDPTKKDSLVPVSDSSSSGSDPGIFIFASDSFG